MKTPVTSVEGTVSAASHPHSAIATSREFGPSLPCAHPDDSATRWPRTARRARDATNLALTGDCIHENSFWMWPTTRLIDRSALALRW